MYCPVCQAKNSHNARFCGNCGFRFSSPGGKNHEGSTLNKYFALDWINIAAVILATLLLVGAVGGYVFWSLVKPSTSWVLAVAPVESGTKLYALSGQSGYSLELVESERNWTPQLHLALDLPALIGSPQSQLSGTWNGGEAVYSPSTRKVIAAVKHLDRWQVSITDLGNGEQHILAEIKANEPFLSIAPAHATTAISVRATHDTPARLQIFAETQELELPQPLPETLFPNARVASNGALLLYTSTNSQTNTSDQVSYRTTFYLVTLKDVHQVPVYEFDHDTKDLPAGVSYAFTPDSKSIVYQAEDKSLYRTTLADFKTTQIYTPAQNVSALQWRITPGSDHITLFTTRSDTPNELSFSLLALDTGQEKVIDQSIKPARVPPLTFLDANHLLYVSSPDQQVIYNLATGKPENFAATKNVRFNCPVISPDHGLVGFSLLDQHSADFHFYNVSRGDVANLDFSFDAPAAGLDLSARYVLFGAQSGLYYKDILSNAKPVQVTDANTELQSAIFTPDQTYLLYATGSGKEPGIYGVKLGKQRSELLLEQAELLAPQPQKWCLGN